jgi:hypothetical protein
MGTKRKVFISHSSSDRKKIDKLASSLKSLGCDIFYSSDITTNKIKFGTYERGIYGQIKKEICESYIVLFMVSENFYSSIPSMIEVGIAYTLGKDMIPISFKSGNYKEDLRAIFNYNQLLPSLDNDEDVYKLLHQISDGANGLDIFKYQKEIVEDIKLKNNIEEKEIDLVDTTGTINIINNNINSALANELVITNDNIKDDVLMVVDKIKRLSSFEYLFIKYLCEDRVNSFCFDENNYHWGSDFERWVKIEGINISREEVWNERFIRLLDRFNLVEDSQGESHITQLGMDTIEHIYDRDKDIIDRIINEYYSIPF